MIGRRIRVLHLIKTLGLGGAEANLANIIRATDRDKYDLSVGYSSGGPIEARLRETGIPMFCFASGEHRIASPATWAIVWHIAAYIRKHHIDVVHTHSFNAHVWGSLAARITGAKVIEHVHDFRYMGSQEYRRRRGAVRQFAYAGICWRSSDRIALLTAGEEAFLKQRGCPASRIVRIPNGIMLNGGPQTAHKPARPTVFTAARISHEKNLDLILRAAPRVAEQVPGVRFVIAGDGPLLDKLRRDVSVAGLEDTVRFIGYQEDVRACLAEADIFFLPSFLELQSIALLEALSAGVPVVVSRDVGCHGEFLEHGKSGFLLDPFGDDGWAETLVLLLKDPGLRRSIGEAGKGICRRFDAHRSAERFGELYAELAA